ncbi:U4/U6 small nuclear ribonucleoprotein prp4 [Ascosphaera aggregata]|nr:U4/U6 small nuclear ribonucleoprotein prp4 [Ascosphaera aggregata]
MSSYQSGSSSASEGEIIESGPYTEAIHSHSFVKDNHVDRIARQSPSYRRSSSITRGHRRERSSSRSPYRASREKRRYENGYDSDRNRPSTYGYSYHSSRHDNRYTSRSDRGHTRDYGRRGRVSYHDYDNYGHVTRERRLERSRSPYRDPRRPKRYTSDEEENEAGGVFLRNNVRDSGRDISRNSPVQSLISEQRTLSANAIASANYSVATKHLNAHANSAALVDNSKNSREGSSGKAIQQAVDNTVAAEPLQDFETSVNPEPLDEAALIQQRRKKREAILAKYRQNQPTPTVVATVSLKSTPFSHHDGDSEVQPSDITTSDERSAPGSAQDLPSVPRTPAVPDLSRDDELANTGKEPGIVEQEEASAVDYDPILDMKEDKFKHDRRHFGSELPAQAYDETKTQKQEVVISQPSAQQPKITKTFDMFAEDDDDDMFADTPPRTAQPDTKPSGGQELDVSMMDNWDDPQGYYNVMLGELFSGRYHVTQNLGRGMFSAVVRAIDSHTGKPVAVKIIRNNDTMRKAGMKEIEILQQLRNADPDDRKHVVRFDRHFDHKGHLCIVFENLSMNLREVLKKFGRDVGINLKAIRVYAQQMFLGLSLFRKCGILHADLKPDNLLVNESRNMLKICDLGSASSASENEITPYLVSRFYRAPEIILGIPYDYAIDMWSIGCTLYELYTGKILFTGRTNNQMLRAMMECRGQFPPKLLRKGSLTHAHFDDLLNFRSVEQDRITGRVVTRMITFKKPTKDLKSRLMGKEASRMSDGDARELGLFVDLLDKCLNLNPEKRCTPAEALKHPFIHRGTL